MTDNSSFGMLMFHPFINDDSEGHRISNLTTITLAFQRFPLDLGLTLATSYISIRFK